MPRMDRASRGRPAQAVTVEGDRPVEVVDGQGDEADLGWHCHLLSGTVYLVVAAVAGLRWR